MREGYDIFKTRRVVQHTQLIIAHSAMSVLLLYTLSGAWNMAGHLRFMALCPPQALVVTVRRASSITMSS